MKNWFRQGQGGGDNSRQIQAAGNVYVNEGMQPSEVYRLCREIVSAEIEQYSDKARVLIDDRIAEFQHNYFMRQAEIAPGTASALEQPFMQRALRSAQIEYASSGDESLGATLIDLVVDLSGQEPRSIRATSTNEAITVAPKLTGHQINALTISSVLRLRTWGWSNPQEMYDGLRELVLPFLDGLPHSGVDYRHMQGVGVSWMGYGSNRGGLPALLLDRYPGLFTHGTLAADVPEFAHTFEGAVINAVRNPDRKQLSLMSGPSLTQVFEQNKFTQEQEEALKNFQRANLMTPFEIVADVGANVPGIESLFTRWVDTNLGDIELSTVGMIIAEANFRSKIKDAPALDF